MLAYSAGEGTLDIMVGHERVNGPFEARSHLNWRQPLVALTALGSVGILGGLAGYKLAQNTEDELRNVHPVEMTVVYEMPYDTSPENIRGYLTGGFDINCGYYSPENTPQPHVTGLEPDYLHVEGDTPQGSQIVGFVEFVPGMLRPGEFGDCDNTPMG